MAPAYNWRHHFILITLGIAVSDDKMQQLTGRATVAFESKQGCPSMRKSSFRDSPFILTTEYELLKNLADSRELFTTTFDRPPFQHIETCIRNIMADYIRSPTSLTIYHPMIWAGVITSTSTRSRDSGLTGQHQDLHSLKHFQAHLRRSWTSLPNPMPCWRRSKLATKIRKWKMVALDYKAYSHYRAPTVMINLGFENFEHG
ncbi:hypothetical protein CC78DRAFT_586332 [Lojkania enalia]|uniref:Uncharacterized protein n=1 Tax=Lojkania enalia TaxID=147567 RepID=A0A9P4MZ32_9PLEO|nr:hypothetical protein CC78DRAFT_586332 [Didymosphaeria enalia]